MIQYFIGGSTLTEGNYAFTQKPACGYDESITVTGVPAFVTYISMYRTKFKWYSVILYALGVLVLYPLFPLCCFINLLYKKPKSKNDPISDDFIEVIF